MKILALDTSTEVCSVALKVVDDVFTRFDDSGVKNTEIILPMIDDIVTEAGIQKQDLDLLTFARGPGGFTGVRVATGVAQGIAFGLNLPVVPLSTLLMMAARTHKQLNQETVYVINDARMGEVYAAAYQLNAEGCWDVLVEECVIKPEALHDVNAKGVIVGSAWAVYETVLSERLSLGDWQVDRSIQPHAEDLLALAEHEHQQGRSVSAENALPVYLRNNVAKKKGER